MRLAAKRTPSSYKHVGAHTHVPEVYQQKEQKHKVG